YNAHGEIIANTNWWLEQPLAGYTGQYHDPETGYIYLRARHYDPVTGQFTTQDPLVAITEEPYGYVGGNPANRTDPTGLCVMGLPCPDAALEVLGYVLGADQALLDLRDLLPVLRRDLGNFDYGRCGAGVVNMTKGLVKVEQGFFAPIVPEPSGLSKALAGYLLVSGGLNLLRGYRQMQNCDRPLTAEERTLQSNLKRLLFGVLPDLVGDKWEAIISVGGFP
ncbi:MAG: RHS repeat-associated core domain-containing protein, partial [Acidimicrobiales bacterium]